MMGTILLSFLVALGLGVFLTDILFGIDAINLRVPLYAFVFLVALGIDYTIIFNRKKFIQPSYNLALNAWY